MRYSASLIAIALLTAGCGKQNLRVDPPKIVHVEVTRYVPVPDELTKPCPVYAPAEQTYAEAKRLALLRLDALEQCNRDKARIRDLAGDETP